MVIALWTVTHIKVDDKVCVRFGGGLEISNWSDHQRELSTLIFLTNDYRDKNPRSECSDVPALRYGETELPYEGHQERLHLRDASIN